MASESEKTDSENPSQSGVADQDPEGGEGQRKSESGQKDTDTDGQKSGPKIEDPRLRRAIGRILKYVRSLASGNGITAKDVRVKDFEGDVYSFRATSRFAVDMKSQSTTRKGRADADKVFEDAGSARQAMDEYVRKLQTAPDIATKIEKAILSREDKGFGLREDIPLTSFRMDFALQKACGTCHGKGKSTCSNCHGKTQVICPRCGGQHEKTCPVCGGSRQVQGANGPQQCSRCHAHGRIPCDYCHGRGQAACPKCGATGAMSCQSCGGQGWESEITRIEPYAKPDFQLETDELPGELQSILRQDGQQLAAHGQIELETGSGGSGGSEGDDDETDAYAPYRAAGASGDEETNSGRMGRIRYSGRIPYGTLTLQLGREDMECTLVGIKGSARNMPPFLESLTYEGRRKLDEAARTKRNVAELLEQVGKYKILRQAILATAAKKQSRAAKLIAQKYPDGISHDTLVNIIKRAESALKRISRRPRYIGMALGLVCVAGLYAGYYLGPGRAYLGQYIQGFYPQMALDLILLALGGPITTTASQIAAKRTFARVFDQLGAGKSGRKIAPTAGHSNLWGYGLGLVLYITILEMTRFRDEVVTPQWFAYVHNLLF